MKITDKRIFTPEGEIREEFRDDFARAHQPNPPPADRPPAEPAEKKVHAPTQASPDREPERSRVKADDNARTAENRQRSVADKAQNPGTPFATFLESLVVQAYMSLGMLRNPYQPQGKVDAAAARQMIEILTLLKEKTNGNLTPDEEDFLATHLGELKLAFVQRTKSL
jgi:hypothetical protein